MRVGRIEVGRRMGVERSQREETREENQEGNGWENGWER